MPVMSRSNAPDGISESNKDATKTTLYQAAIKLHKTYNQKTLSPACMKQR